MEKLLKKTNNPLIAVLNDLKLFEQTKYCFNYLKNKFPNESDDVLEYHAEISSSSFRQAKEYYNAALETTLNANPLLYSYSLNNLLKGTCYLLSFDDEILKGFKNHGFKVESSDLLDNILDSQVTFMKRNGAVHSLLKLFNNSLGSPQNINFYQLLRHIPGLEDIYYKTTGCISLIAKKDINNCDEYIIIGCEINDDIKRIFEEFGFVCQILRRYDCCVGYKNLKNKHLMDKNIYNENNISYKEYLNFPEKFNEGIKDINISFYCYLLIMSYGMLVRYNAHKWEKYVDKKNSNEAILVELSIKNAVEHFYYQMHSLLFEYSYENKIYNDNDVKRVINESTITIMNNITNEIENQNIVYNRKDSLPWHKDYS